MTLGESVRPGHAGHLMENQVEDELTLYDPRSEVVHILNPTAAAVWQLADGVRKVSDISAQFAELFDMDLGEVEEDVQDILEQFQGAGLLQNHNGMASRELLQYVAARPG